jgi:splicing factor 3A subunit 2
MSTPGSGGVASGSQANVQRRARLRQLAQETADLRNDPYFGRDHLGQYTCRLCLAVMTTEAGYIIHTQGKKHQQNLAKRQAQLAARKGSSDGLHQSGSDSTMSTAAAAAAAARRKPKHYVPTAGKPGYNLIKQFDHETGQRSLLFQIMYPKIAVGIQPRHRLMSTYEQKVESRDPTVQYLVIAAEPYENVAFKIPRWDIDRSEGKFFTHWDADKQQFTLQLFFHKSSYSNKAAITDTADADTTNADTTMR